MKFFFPTRDYLFKVNLKIRDKLDSDRRHLSLSSNFVNLIDEMGDKINTFIEDVNNGIGLNKKFFYFKKYTTYPKKNINPTVNDTSWSLAYYIKAIYDLLEIPLSKYSNCIISGGIGDHTDYNHTNAIDLIKEKFITSIKLLLSEDELYKKDNIFIYNSSEQIENLVQLLKENSFEIIDENHETNKYNLQIKYDDKEIFLTLLKIETVSEVLNELFEKWLPSERDEYNDFKKIDGFFEKLKKRFEGFLFDERDHIKPSKIYIGQPNNSGYTIRVYSSRSRTYSVSLMYCTNSTEKEGYGVWVHCANAYRYYLQHIDDDFVEKWIAFIKNDLKIDITKGNTIKDDVIIPVSLLLNNFEEVVTYIAKLRGVSFY